MAHFEGMYEQVLRSLTQARDGLRTAQLPEFGRVFPVRLLHEFVSTPYYTRGGGSASFIGLPIDLAEPGDLSIAASWVPIEDNIPDDTALSWEDWNDKVDALLAECGEKAR